MQDLSEVPGILDQMYAVQGDTDAKEQEATIELDNYEDGNGFCTHHDI